MAVCLYGYVPVSYTHLDVYKRQMKKQVKEYTELTVNVRWYEERADYSECISVGDLSLIHISV